MKYDIVIGIDPDVEKSGYVVVESATGKVTTATNWDLSKLYGVLAAEKEYYSIKGLKMLVVVEAAYLGSHHNWHLGGGYVSPAKAATIGYHSGRNHETGRAIVEFCRYLEVDVIPQKPLKKCWKGPDKKITHDEITKITKWDKKRSNQEIRDALLLAWMHTTQPMIL